MVMYRVQITILFSFFLAHSYSQFSDLKINRIDNRDSSGQWSIHFQNTTIPQYQSGFAVNYSGANSLSPNPELAVSNTTTFSIGRRLWKNGILIVNQETTGGNGLSKTKGIAGFPNGEIYRVGATHLTPFIARVYLQQIIPLKNSAYEFQTTDQNQLAGKIPSSRIVITAGKFCISDFFDDNSYSHDARSQFLNWSLMAQGAWDFPADVRGYTTGIVMELIKPDWAIRFSSVEVPKIANALPMEWNINGAHAETIELEKHWKNKHNLSGAIRLTGFITFSRAPYYSDAINAMRKGDSSLNNIIDGSAEGNKYVGNKHGFGINLEQELSKSLGLFSRYSWNDGKTASWAFTEIDRNFQLGFELKGNTWKRKKDVLGFAGVINGIASEHIAYLKAGGYGFIIGDGNLNYSKESIFETYYRYYIASFVQLSCDYQIVINPGYNRDRSGPVYIPSIRLHFEL